MQHAPVLDPAPYRRRPRALVIFDPPPEDLGVAIDWSPWYLTDEEDVAHAPEHNEASNTFAGSLGELFRERGAEGERVAQDEFFGWIQAEPLVRVSPDVFVMPDPHGPPFPRMWETWLPGSSPPRFALEIVSADWKKDYDDNPPKYWQLGTRELVIFDVEAKAHRPRGAKRVPLQVYRRDADGAFVRVYAGDGPAHSAELDAWLVVRREGEVSRLRLSRDEAGKVLVPTTDEALAAAEQRAALAEQRADQASQRAEQASRENALLAARLRELGIDPSALR
jgi:hypothetical protein